MSFTDFLRLGELKIFKEVCENLPKNLTNTLSLVTVRDNVLFTWDFQNNCVLSLNVKAARSKDGDNVIHQKLLPLHPPLFTPEFLVTNETNTLLAVAGPNGVLVLQLPARCPPHGAFDNNKEVVYCRSYSLDERLLACSDVIEVRQARFHPGSVNDSHILVLTSDNLLRLYQVKDKEALNLAVYPIGESPGGMFPGSKTPFLDLFGEIAVDFDFGLPEVPQEPLWKQFEEMKITDNVKKSSLVKYDSLKSITSTKITPKSKENVKESDSKNNFKNLVWPVYILRGDFSIYSISIDLSRQTKPVLKGPYPICGQPEGLDSDACSLICLNTTPQIICATSSTGTLVHSVVLTMEEAYQEELRQASQKPSDVPSKELLVFETVELELGLTVFQDLDEDIQKYKCPIYLHRDESKLSRFFASHSAGVHSVNVACVEELQSYVFGPEDIDPTSDIFASSSSAEYLVCTKTANSEKSNSVIGFSLYYEPVSIITLLADGSVVTLGILTAPLLPKDELSMEKTTEEVTSPLKKMLNEPFDQYIQKILKKASSQPVLKLPSTSTNTPEECYELLQRASQVFREEHFKYHNKAREEIEKRVHTLRMLKDTQAKEIEKMNAGKDSLRESAENLAEKYEDIKDKQDELLKRCELLLMLVSRKKPQASDAEKKFIKDLNGFSTKSAAYQTAVDKLNNKLKYQQLQIRNWKAQETKKVAALNEIQSNTIKNSLQESTQKINDMIKEVGKYKKQLNIK